jgi:hypothetical protein
MVWSKGDIWRVTVELPPGEYDFKAAVTESGVNSHGDWEPGANRTLRVGALWCGMGDVSAYKHLQLARQTMPGVYDWARLVRWPL